MEPVEPVAPVAPVTILAISVGIWSNVIEDAEPVLERMALAMLPNLVTNVS